MLFFWTTTTSARHINAYDVYGSRNCVACSLSGFPRLQILEPKGLLEDTGREFSSILCLFFLCRRSRLASFADERTNGSKARDPTSEDAVGHGRVRAMERGLGC